MKSINKFYGDNYFKLVFFAENRGKRGDGLWLSEEDASDLIGDILLYHLSHPDKFMASHIYNTIIQRRKNVYRDRATEARLKKEMVEHHRSGKADGEIGLDPSIILENIYTGLSIADEIAKESDFVKREVLSRHFLLGEGIQQAVNVVEGSNRMMIQRFKDRIEADYKEMED